MTPTEDLRHSPLDAAVLAAREARRLDMPHDLGPEYCLHLMSVISPVRDDLVVLYPKMTPTRLVQALEAAAGHRRDLEHVVTLEVEGRDVGLRADHHPGSVEELGPVALELVEGPTLAEVLTRAPGRRVDIARALEAALRITSQELKHRARVETRLGPLPAVARSIDGPHGTFAHLEWTPDNGASIGQA